MVALGADPPKASNKGSKQPASDITTYNITSSTQMLLDRS